MANKKKEDKPTDASMAAASEIYNVARQQADEEMAKLKGEIVAIREESEALGALKKIRCDIAYNETLRYMILYRIKQSKDYKKGGLSWVEFCDAIGEPQRTVDRIIEEMKPIYEKFSANLADLSGYGLNKIRHLGKALSGNLAEIQDGVIVFEGEKIPLTPEYKDEIEAILDQLKDGLKEREDEEKAQKKASDRIANDTHKELTKLHQQLDKLEGKAKTKGLAAEEDAFITKMEGIKRQFDLVFGMNLDPLNMAELKHSVEGDDEQKDGQKKKNKETRFEPTKRMKAAYLTTLSYMKMQILAYHDTAFDYYGDASMTPEEGWKQPE